MNYKNQKGFTLIEVMVVAGIIAILAGVLVPMIFNQIDESKKTRAQADIKSIQTGISKFRLDTGAWPNRTDGSLATTNTVEVLRSPGNNIRTGTSWDMPAEPLVDYLGSENNKTYPKATWKGPYMSSVEADPWGNTYLVAARNFENGLEADGVTPIDRTGLPVMIVSAGPDGILQTPIDSGDCYDGKKLDSQTPPVPMFAGDDICLRFK